MAAKRISQEIICTADDDASDRQAMCAGPVSKTTIEELDESAISALIGFFQRLDNWDLEAKSNGKAI